MLTQPNIKASVYPETNIVGRSRCDGTLHFYSRVRNAVNWGDVPKLTIVDVGCGSGSWYWTDAYHIRRFRPYGHVIGIDVDDCSDNPSINEFRLVPPSGQWPVDDNSVDLVICDYVLEHIEDPDVFFLEAERVLKPGGVFAARTPNKWCYVSMLARLIPNRCHPRFVPREEAEVYPTRYKCNTARKLRYLLRSNHLTGAVYAIECEPRYFDRWPWLYRLMSVVHRWLSDCFKSTLIVFARAER